MQQTPYIRLSGFYFFYFSLLGALVPFWSLYLDGQGYTPQMIGLLMAILHGSRIIAPNIWGWLADKTGRRVSIVRWGAGLTCLCFAAIFWQDQFLGMALVTAAFSFFWNAVLPQFEVLTLAHLGEKRAKYSQIRLWGSVGFIVAVVGLGWLFDNVSVQWLSHVLLGLMFLIWFNSLVVPAPKQVVDTASVDDRFFQQLWRLPVIVFFVVMFLVQFSHGPYYTFYSVLMEQLGYDRINIGLLWALGVLAEVAIFVWMPQLLKSCGVRQLLLASLLFAALRWCLVGYFADSLMLMVFAQLLHAASFGVVHAVGIALVHHYFSEKTYGQAQALFSSVGFGAGGALGALLSGFLWSSLGSAATFTIAAVAAFIGFVLAYVWLRPANI